MNARSRKYLQAGARKISGAHQGARAGATFVMTGTAVAASKKCAPSGRGVSPSSA
ncbi:MAG TPA: hypothetical protein VEZ40_03115 [Pyrinomonadaceae bacterium]|nr:hypothetical protein [Pyrinomonadaceae bacterium]